MKALKKLLGSDESQEDEVKKGIVWASFERKFETWHFGPNDEKDVTYDGRVDNAIYRFKDDESDSRRTVAYRKELKGNYEVELFVDERLDEQWKEKRRENKTMYLVANGSWDGSDLKYEQPVLCVEKETFQKLKEEANIANTRSATAKPHGIHKQLRKR